jgi:hypothetical protein
MNAIYSDSFRACPRNQNFIGDEYEDDDEDEVRTLQPRVEFHENDIGFMKFHTSGGAYMKLRMIA